MVVKSDIDADASPIAARAGEREALARDYGRFYTAAAFLLCVLTFTVGAIRWTQLHDEMGGPVGLFTQTDFPAVTIASRLIGSGRVGELYNLQSQLAEQQQLVREGILALTPGQAATLHYPYPYAPFLALFWALVGWVPPFTQMALYGLLNIAGMSVGMWLLLRVLSLSRLARFLFLLAALTSFPFVNNLEQGQSSGVVMFAFALGVALMRQERDLPAGLALGLLVIKVQWLPVIALVLLFKRRWGALVGIALTAALMLALAIAMMGTAWIPGYIDMLGQAQSWSRALLLDPWYSHSLGGALTALLGRGTDAVVRPLHLLGTLVVVGFLLWAWRGKWQPGTPRWDGLMSLALLAAFFTNAHVNTHDLSLLVLPAALGTAYLYGSGQSLNTRLAWFGMLWASYIAPTFFLGEVFAWPVRLTTLLIALLMCLLIVRIERAPKAEASVTYSGP